MTKATLSPKKQALKRIFLSTHKDTPAAQKVKEYLQEVHGITVPEDFDTKLISAHTAYHGTPFNLNLSLVDSIVESCLYWIDYVQDWDALVCQEVLSMCWIHTSVIWLRSLTRDGVVLKKQPPCYFETTVTHNGLIKVSG